MNVVAFMVLRLFLVFLCLSTAAGAAVSMMGLYTYQNQIKNGVGQPVRVHGVSRGYYDTCATGSSIIYGNTDQNSVSVMLGWKINVVKILVNSNCWLDIPGRSPSFGGSQYRTALINYVRLLANNNMGIILALATADSPSSSSCTGSGPMPDAYSTTFWANITQVFNTANNFTSVMYEVYHQPYPAAGAVTTAAWQCWLNGGSSCSETYSIVGMASLISTIRTYSSSNIIIVPGISHGNSLASFLTYASSLYSSRNNIVAGVAVTDQAIHAWCNDASCWLSEYGAVNSANWPIIVTSASSVGCLSPIFVVSVQNWADCYSAGQIGYVVDTWMPTTLLNCNTGLIVEPSGNPANAYGLSVQTTLAS